MAWVAVRCSDQPEKVLGYLQGRAEGTCRVFFFEHRYRTERIEVPLGLYQAADGTRELAYEAKDLPIETLRRLPGFVEAPWLG
jgi:hypothetical protein